MDDKTKYRKFCESDEGKDIPLFIKPWYLDAVSDGNWDVILVEKGGEVVGAFPIYMRKKLVFRLIVMPLLTPYIGPYIKYPKGQKYYRKLSWEKEIIGSILEQLPEYDFMSVDLYYGITNCLPFMWKGFDCKVRYTYMIEHGKSLNDLISEFEVDVRRKIKRAENFRIVVEEDYDIRSFYEINKATFLRKGMNIPYSFSVVDKIFRSCRERNACKILFAFDRDGRRLGAGFFVKDEKNYYYLMGGITEEGGKVGAMEKILLEAIKIAMEESLNFDFEG